MTRTPLVLAALLLPGAALAHTGTGAHGTPFAAGVLHPLLGADHLLAMVAVGLLAAITGGRAILAFPASFVGGMVAGGVLGFGGAALPIVEPAILASVVLLGLAVACAVRLPLALASAAVAAFGVAHGYAHGLEAPALGGAAYAAGFVLATVALHGVGLALGRPGIVRALGGLTAVAGLVLAAG